MSKAISAPEKFIVIAILGIGLIACLATPIGAGYDEETHFIRAWEMAHLYFIPNERLGYNLPFPALYHELSYRRQPIVRTVEPGLWTKYGKLSLDAHDYVYANVETRSVYSPALLLPQALALRYLGLNLQLPALVVYYACRITGLLSYLMLCLLAIRLIPFGKWLLAILAVSPMAIFQASTISADTISNGIAFLFIGALLAIAHGSHLAHSRARSGNRSYGPQNKNRAGERTYTEAGYVGEIGWKQWLVLLGLIAVLYLGKVNLLFLVLLPFLLIHPSRFRMKYGYILLAAASLALFMIEVVGWNTVAYSHFTRALAGADPGQQLRFILAYPALFVQIIVQDIWTNMPAYVRGWVGVYGYNYWPVPEVTYMLYPLAVLASLWQDASPNSPDRRTRIILLPLFLCGFLLTIISLYVAFTPARSLFVAGVQGRYFTVVFPLIFLAFLSIPSVMLLRGKRWAMKQSSVGSKWSDSSYRLASSSAPVLASGALLLFAMGLILSYHVPCGSEYYRWSLCYQPQYKNWAPESVSSPPITPMVSLTQEIVPECDGMTEVSVWVNSNGTNPGGTTTLLLRAPTQDKDLAIRTILNDEIIQGQWLSVDLDPELASKEQLYLLKLTGSSPGGIQVGYSASPEYLRGKLLENGIPISQDILFQYGCVAGLKRAFLWGR